MIRNNNTSIHKKTFILSYSIPNIDKKQLADDLKYRLKHVVVLLIAEYKKKSQSPSFPVNEKKYLVYLEFDQERRKKRNAFDIRGITPVFKRYTKKKVLEKIKEKDPAPYQQGFDLDEKINAIKYKKGSTFAQNIYLLNAGKTTLDEIAEKYPVDFINNKRKYSEYQNYTFSKRKKRRIEEGIILPSKFKKINQNYVKKYNDLYQIAKWYNFRLVDQIWNKNVSGLYIWGRPKGIGKNQFVYLLRRIDPNVYEWDKNDNGWQQHWDKTKEYSLIAFNAISNSKHVPFNIFEDFGDQESTITIKKRFDSEPDYISAQTPWIVTANKPPEEIYPKEDVEVIYERALVVELEEDLFDFINWIAKENGVEECKPDRSFETYGEESTDIEPMKVEQVESESLDDTLSSDESEEEKDIEQ